MEFLKIEHAGSEGRAERYLVEFEEEQTREAVGLAYRMMCESEGVQFDENPDIHGALAARLGEGAVRGYLANFLVNYVASSVAETLPFFPFGQPKVMQPGGDRQPGLVTLMVEFARTPEYELSDYSPLTVYVPSEHIDEDGKARLILDEIGERFVGTIAEGDYMVARDEYTERFLAMLEKEGLALPQYCKQKGVSQDELKRSMMYEIRDRFAEEMALDAICRHHGLEATEDDEMVVLMQLDFDKPRKIGTMLKESRLYYRIRQQARRQRARRWLLETTEFVVGERLSSW